MKNQNQAVISLDEFRLHLGEIMDLERELDRKKQEEKEEFVLYKLQQFPMSITSTTSWVYFSIHLLWPIHLVISYTKCFFTAFNKESLILTLYRMLSDYQLIGIGINSSLITLIYLSILFPEIKKDSELLFLFQYVGSKIYPYLRYLIEIALYLTAFFALSNNAGNWILFALAAFASLVSTALLQNFTLRKDQFCCKSPEFSLIWRIVLLLSLVIGNVGCNSIKNGWHLLIWSSVMLLLGSLLLIFYFSFGVYIYRRTIPRFYFFFLINSFFALSTASFFDMVQAQSSSKYNYLLLAPLFLAVATFFNWSTLEKRRRISVCPECKDIKQKVFFLFNKFESCDTNDEDDCEIRGMLHYHYVVGCSNNRCVVNLKEVYDSKKKQNCSIMSIGKSRASLIKFLVKCIYEKALEEDPQNIELQLDFVEFYYFKLKNIFCVLQRIEHLEKNLLSPFQRLRLSRLKKFIKEEANGFSEELYSQTLVLEKTLKAEQIFEIIQNKMEVVIKRNELFWKYLQRNEVLLNDLLDTIKPNFQLIDELTDQWSKISEHFGINRRWKFYFLCFSLFIKNEKLKSNQIQDFGNSVEYDIIFKTGNHFIDKTTQKEELFNPIMLFEQNTCFIAVSCDQEKMIIKRVSSYFKRNFDFQPKDIINSSIQCLMPSSISSFHHTMFLNWLKEGRTNNEEYYKMKKIMPLTNGRYLAPCFKFYKYYLGQNNEIEYIAMLKRNKKDEMMALVNQNFEIQAITFGLAQKLKIEEREYQFLMGLNLLSLIPLLAKYTRYVKFINQHDEDFSQNDQNQLFFKRQSSFTKGQLMEQIDVISMRKILNLTNVKLMIPTNLQEVQQRYIAFKKEKREDQFKVVKDLFSSIKKEKNYLKFKGEIYIYLRSYHPFTDKKFYEIQFIELQESNKLEKLMQEVEEENSVNSQSSKSEDGNYIEKVDINNFFQLNKKKNKVMLFPSNNIFLKDQSNQALQQITHIDNIKISIRCIVIIFIAILVTILVAEMIVAEQIKLITLKMDSIDRFQKIGWLDNNMYNMQHIEPEAPIQTVFFLRMFGKVIKETFSSLIFQKLLFDPDINPLVVIKPYFPDPYPYPILANISSFPLGSVAAFRKLFEGIVSLETCVNMNKSDSLENANFHQYNNYIFGAFEKSQNVRMNLIRAYQTVSETLHSLIIAMVITEIILILLSFLFSFTRLLKVTNGFSELLSIFVQMNDSDVKKITKFTNYTKNLFTHLKYKYERMGDSQSGMSSSASFDLQKPSSSNEPANEEQIQNSTVIANLNKKLKKLQPGSEIQRIKCKTAGLIIAFLLLVGLSLFLPIIYSVSSLTKLNQVQNIGFTMLYRVSMPNGIINAVFQKFRGAQIYRYQKYQIFLNSFEAYLKSETPLKLASGESALAHHFKTIYFQNFCEQIPQVFTGILSQIVSAMCDIATPDPQVCSQFKNHLTGEYFLNRCKTIQNQQLTKGLLNYYNFLVNRYGRLYLSDAFTVNIDQIRELSDVIFVVTFYEYSLNMLWTKQTYAILQGRLVNIIIISIAAFLLIILLHLIFVEYLISKTLNNSYEMFRRMHQNLIPQFVISKQKIIKAKLIKQGFMKE